MDEPLQPVDGLTEDALYSVRVIAGNDAGDSPPSEETLGRPQDGVTGLLAKTVNGRTLTLRFSERLDQNSVPAETDFVVMADGGLIAVDSVAISGDEVTFTLTPDRNGRQLRPGALRQAHRPVGSVPA